MWAALCLALLLQTAAALTRNQNQLCEIYFDAREDGFKSLFLVGLSQNLRNSTLAELAPLIDEARALGATCCSDAPTADCNRDLADTFQRVVCSSETLVERNHLKSCCEKSGEERTTCFLGAKAQAPPDLKQNLLMAAGDCSAFDVNNKVFVGNFIFNFCKRNVLASPVAVLEIAKDYGAVMQTCCADADKQNCFDSKRAAFEAGVNNLLAKQRALCIVYKTYGDRVLKAKKMVQCSQKLPQVPAETIMSVVRQNVLTAAPCCRGNMIECMRMKKQLIEEVCARQELVSMTTNLAACCKADALSREGCIATMKADAKPEGLSESYDLQANIQDVCSAFSKDQEMAMGNLIYELSRRHPESSESIILAHAHDAEEAFLKCCDKEDKAECTKTAMTGHDLEKDITDTVTEYRALAETLKAGGNAKFGKLFFVRYTRIMPQADFDVLQRIANSVSSTLKQCLNDPAHPILECQNRVTDALDGFCNDLEPEKINAQIAGCCKQLYSQRGACIKALATDANFKAAEPVVRQLQLGANLCVEDAKAAAGAEAAAGAGAAAGAAAATGAAAGADPNELRLLYDTLRGNIAATDEQLSNVSKVFQAAKSKCCAEADQAACFQAEAPKFEGLAVAAVAA